MGHAQVAGVLRAHTPIGVSKQSQRVKLSIRSKDRQGSGLAGVVVLKERLNLARLASIAATLIGTAILKFSR